MEAFKLYNNTLELNFDSVIHTYKVGEKIIPSVTGIVGVVNKPAILYWGINMAIESVRTSIKPGVALDEMEIESMLDTAKKAHRVKTDHAANLGTKIHAWIEEFINWKLKQGDKPQVPVNKQMQMAVNSFLKWVKEHKVEFLSTETKIYSKKYEYAGTMDFEAMIDGKLVLGDIKTSSGIWPEMRFQTAAYMQARQEEVGLEYDHRLIVRIGKDKPEVEIQKLLEFEKDFGAFLGCLKLYNRLRELDR
jgi:hypothetical protein